MGLWSLLTGRRKKDIPTADARRPRRGRFESLEDRRLMDADPLKIGVTYHEEDGGSDLHGDKFEILFEGGAPGTELTQLVINGDHGSTGLSVGDMIFDTIKGGLGADEAFSLQIVSSTGIQDVSWQVSDGGLSLTFNFQGFNAGEKLRADFWFAQMSPSVTQSWSLTAGSGGGTRSAPGTGVEIADNVIASAERVRRTLAAVGPEHAGILIDVCCHLKGLEDVERRAGWPRRSAKIVLGMALASLARHYGFSAEERARRPAAVRHWGASGYRPSIDGTSEAGGE